MTTIQDLGLAYRKAKVGLYYSSHASLDAIADYEDELQANLSAMLANIRGEDQLWVTQADFIGCWHRDLLRVKGDITDYCVIGEIDVQTLRQFQGSHRSPAKPFKPVSDGFEIDFGRKVLPAGETD